MRRLSKTTGRHWLVVCKLSKCIVYRVVWVHFFEQAVGFGIFFEVAVWLGGLNRWFKMLDQAVAIPGDFAGPHSSFKAAKEPLTQDIVGFVWIIFQRCYQAHGSKRSIAYHNAWIIEIKRKRSQWLSHWTKNLSFPHLRYDSLPPVCYHLFYYLLNISFTRFCFLFLNT